MRAEAHRLLDALNGLKHLQPREVTLAQTGDDESSVWAQSPDPPMSMVQDFHVSGSELPSLTLPYTALHHALRLAKDGEVELTTENGLLRVVGAGVDSTVHCLATTPSRYKWSAPAVSALGRDVLEVARRVVWATRWAKPEHSAVRLAGDWVTGTDANEVAHLIKSEDACGIVLGIPPHVLAAMDALGELNAMPAAYSEQWIKIDGQLGVLTAALHSGKLPTIVPESIIEKHSSPHGINLSLPGLKAVMRELASASGEENRRVVVDLHEDSPTITLTADRADASYRVEIEAEIVGEPEFPFKLRMPVMAETIEHWGEETLPLRWNPGRPLLAVSEDQREIILIQRTMIR